MRMVPVPMNGERYSMCRSRTTWNWSGLSSTRRSHLPPVEDDAAAVAHLRLEVLELVMDHFIARVFRAHPFVLVKRGNVIGDRPADEELAGAGGGDGDGVVGRVRARADDRRVADAAVLLV